MQINTYEEWKYCIEVSCGIKLTKTFIEQRIKELSDNSDAHTKSFTALYGTDYKNQIIEWFGIAYNSF
jgi:hypothetical protein